MDLRSMPLVTFRCEICGEQTTIRADDFHRHEDKPDRVVPHPSHDNKLMDIIQVQYSSGEN